jgi:hypothetical protein
MSNKKEEKGYGNFCKTPEIGQKLLEIVIKNKLEDIFGGKKNEKKKK